MANRFLRVGSLIHAELNKIILRELDLPDGVLATISEVNVSEDLRNAKIGISIFPSEKSDEVMPVFTKWQGEAQFLLGRKLNIRPMPRIRFTLDRGLEKAADIERLLIQEERGKVDKSK